MINTSPTKKEWRKLYDVAVKLKEIAPWEWMYEDNIFVVQNPNTTQVGFVSIMGSIGEHFAVAAYLGERGYYKYLELMQAERDILAYQLFFKRRL